MRLTVSATAKALLILVILVYIFHFLFFWIYETTDSWFYWAFANYIRTGDYQAPHPYYYYMPSTMEPPLYSVFLYLVQFFPKADIFVHFFQLGGLLAAAYFLHMMLNRFLHKGVSLICASLFLLIPDNLVYASNLLSEVMVIPAVAFYLYLLMKIIIDKKEHLLGLMVLYSALLTLLRYNLGVFFVLSVIIFLNSIIRRDTQRIAFFRPDRFNTYYFILGWLVLFFWIAINHVLNGSWGMSSGLGKNLYDRVVMQNRLLPKNENPHLLTLVSLLDGKVSVFQPWWPIEAYLIYYKNLNETQVNSLLQHVAVSAIKDNPVSFARDSIGMFLSSYNQSTSYPGGYLYSYQIYMTNKCRKLGGIEFCNPIIQSPIGKTVWDGIVKFGEDATSKFNISFTYLVLFPLLIFSLWQKDLFLKWAGIHYLLGVFIPSLTAHADSRYLYPLIGLKWLIVILSLNVIYNRLRKVRIRKSYN